MGNATSRSSRLNDAAPHRPTAAGVLSIAQVWMWALVVRALKHVVPLPALVRILRAGIRIRPCPERVELLCRLARGPSLLPPNCLDRSLALFRLFLSAGASPHIVVGVRAGTHARFAGHVWIRLGVESLGETEEDQRTFDGVLEFDARGRLADVPVIATPSRP